MPKKIVNSLARRKPPHVTIFVFKHLFPDFMTSYWHV